MGWRSNSMIISTCYTVFFLTAIADKAASAEPSALSLPVRTDWLGYDGNWSPVSIRVGTPPQWVDVFVSTASQETWVVGSGGCDGTQKCRTERGGIFESNASSTWEDQGPFTLGLDPQLGFDGDGIYGFDSLALSDQISVPCQVVGVINTTDYWLGFFGLGVKPTNFTSADKPTFLASMVENQSLIPSHSYGYTAGAYYRLKSVPGSLVLGGFDANRFEPHDVTFVLDPDQNPVVSLNEITVTAEPLLSSNVSTNWPGDSLTLLESGDSNLFTIDSSTPYLWLPDSVCSKFERALGLTYDDSLQLYTFGSNSSQHDVLVNWNMTFHFRIADLPESPNLVSLSLPYAAFDLQLSYPYPGLLAHESSPPTNYFPLRKAADSTQYTIGRAFLQETYLKVDYERNNFSIHKATFSQSALTDTDLISITRPKNSIFGGPKVSRKPALSKAAIAGIAIGTLVSSIASFILFISVHRARSSQRYEGKNDSVFKQGKGSSNSRVIRWLFRLPRPDAPTEMGASYRFAFEAPHDREIMELPAKSSKRELEGSQPYTPQHQETNYSNKGNAVYAIGHDPEKPVELPYRSSARGYYEPETGPQMPFANPNTALVDASVKSAWGLSRQNTQTSAAISGPTSTSSKRSSKESSPVFIVSPMTPREVSPIFPREMSPEYSSLSIIARREARYSSNDSRVRQYRGHDTSASSDNLVSGDFQSSNGSTMIDHALQGPRQLFSR